MKDFEEGLNLLEEKFGKGRDNIIALATITREPSERRMPRPAVRGVNAYYENGIFYVTTNGLSNKIKQIHDNSEVSIASCSEMFTANGVGNNLGWILNPENLRLRDKLRSVFSTWYDSANDENDVNCCILEIRITKAMLNINHWEKIYYMDFINRVSMDNGGVF